MPLPEREKNKKVTCRDYLNWPDAERWEIINGEAWAMTPAPSIRMKDSAFGNIGLFIWMMN